MDALIFYVFLLVLAVAFLIEGQRATSRARPVQAREVERPWWVQAIMIPAFVIAALVSKVFIEPAIADHVPGANTAWVVSFIAICVLLGGTMFAIDRLGRRSSQVDASD